MKKIFALVLSVCITTSAYADTCATGLMPLFTGPQAKEICATFSAGTIGVLANDTYAVGRNAADSGNINVWKVDSSDETIINSDSGDSIHLQIGGDANRLYNFLGSSDTALQMTWGDGGTTATQVFSILASTSDADDDSTFCFGAGGGCGSTRGGYITGDGNEVASTGGRIQIIGGAISTGDVAMGTGHASAVIKFVDLGGNKMWSITDGGLFSNHGGEAGDMNLSATGTTLAVQEATAGSACSGTLTLTAATPVVVSTTCATAGSRVFLTRTSIDADTTGDMAVTALSAGVSFSVTSEASDTGTVNWLIVHEAV